MNQKEHLQKTIDVVLQTAYNINAEVHSKKRTEAISGLTFLQKQLTCTDFEITNEKLQKYLYPIVFDFIELVPRLRSQLVMLWNSFVSLTKEVNKKKENVLIDLFDYGKVNDMIKLTNQHNKSISKFKRMPNEESHLLALFYCHIVRVEVFENVIKNEYGQLLKDNHIDKLYNLNEIFSVEKSSSKKNRKGIEIITDVRAVRHCLAHNLYSIQQTDKDWAIVFDTGTKDKTLYSKEFSKLEFVSFLNDSNLLYHLALMLMQLFSIITQLKNYANETLKIVAITEKK